jgi:hypothetical protein
MVEAVSGERQEGVHVTHDRRDPFLHEVWYIAEQSLNHRDTAEGTDEGPEPHNVVLLWRRGYLPVSQPE